MRQLVAACPQPEGVDQLGRGLEHQLLPQWYSQVGGIVAVQRATEEVVVEVEDVLVEDEDVLLEVEEVVLEVEDVVLEVEDVVLEVEDVVLEVEDVVDDVVEGGGEVELQG